MLICTFVISRPFVRAPGGVRRPPGTYATPVSSRDIGERIVPLTTSSRPQPTHSIAPQISNEVSNKLTNDQYNCNTDLLNDIEANDDSSFENVMAQIRYFEKLEVDCSKNFKGVKGRLASHLEFWRKIGASDFVLDTIQNGYVIPFLEPPMSMFLKNNKSSLKNADFVDHAISDLLDTGCIQEVPFKPFVVNPLSVATQNSCKKRLILDVSLLNKCVKKDKFKFEDWRLALQMFSKDCFMFKYDLKSGYHHFDICPQQHTYLGFSWKNKFYCFTVLVFGLASNPYLFSKCLRAMVKYWRQNCINIVLYLDDGFGMSHSIQEANTLSKFVEQSLIYAGLLINEEKSIFEPVQSLEWSGIVWDSRSFTLSIPQRRIHDLLKNIKLLISIFPLFTARQLAQVTGKVISISSVVGNLTRLMSRYCYLTIENRSYWDENLDILYPQEVLSELKFWIDNVHTVNRKVLASYCPSSFIMYSDASNLACGAYCVEVQNKVFYRMWNEIEVNQSSTWRELKAIEQALFTFIYDLTGKNIKWFTDNQNCLRIIKAGSMKQHLQRLALSIFSVCMRENI